MHIRFNISASHRHLLSESFWGLLNVFLTIAMVAGLYYIYQYESQKHERWRDRKCLEVYEQEMTAHQENIQYLEHERRTALQSNNSRLADVLATQLAATRTEALETARYGVMMKCGEAARRLRELEMSR
jgi:hypothetical protein